MLEWTRWHRGCGAYPVNLLDMILKSNVTDRLLYIYISKMKSTFFNVLVINNCYSMQVYKGPRTYLSKKLNHAASCTVKQSSLN